MPPLRTTAASTWVSVVYSRMLHAGRQYVSRIARAARRWAAPLLAVTIATGGEALLAQKIAPPSSSEERRLIDEGNELREHQDFDGALARYHRVLGANPDNMDALVELAGVLYAKGAFDTSLASARRGMDYESDHVAHFHMLAGACLEAQGHRDSALAVYRAGLVRDPGSYLLHYNLGIALIPTGAYADAAAQFEQALTTNPNHAGSHLALGQVYFGLGFRVPAFMALARALTLEPATVRAEAAVRRVEQTLGIGTAGEPLVWKNATTYGDFGAVRAVLKSFTPTRGRGDMSLFAERVGRICRALESAGAGRFGNTFTVRQYVPYFAALSRIGLAEPFAYHITRAAGKDGSGAWLETNASRVEAFLAWSRAYRPGAPMN